MLNQVAQERLERRLRLLISWRDKAHALASGKKESRPFDLPPGRTVENGTAYFEAQAKQAERELDAFLARLRQRLQHATDLVQVATHQQQSLPDRVARGRLTPVQANDENRRLQQEVEEQSTEASLTHKLLQSATTEALGGHIEMPLPRYARELERFASSGTPAKKTPVAPASDAAPPGKPAKKPTGPRSGPGFRLDRWDRWAIGGAVLVLVLFALFMTARNRLGGEITFDLLPAPEGMWRLVCQNTQRHEVTLGVPEDGVGNRQCDYRVVMEARNNKETPFRKLPGTAPAWTFQGTAGETNPYTLGPSLTGSWTFNPRHPAISASLGGLRIRVLTQSGREVFANDLTVEVRP